MHQRCTQSYVRRPYGVGLLVATYDQTGPHLYQTQPSGEYFECNAMAIGSRSQTSRTYLEREYESFPDCDLDSLIKHALKALSVSLAGKCIFTYICMFFLRSMCCVVLCYGVLAWRDVFLFLYLVMSCHAI